MNKIKVVLIEDDEAIVDMYTMRLELASDFELKVANNGAAGLELIDSFKPDIVLLDMMMPRMSGIEALTRLRKLPHGKDYKVIALTNMKDEDTVATVNKLGIQDYIVKAELPINELEERIRAVVSRTS